MGCDAERKKFMSVTEAPDPCISTPLAILYPVDICREHRHFVVKLNTSALCHCHAKRLHNNLNILPPTSPMSLQKK